MVRILAFALLASCGGSVTTAPADSGGEVSFDLGVIEDVRTEDTARTPPSPCPSAPPLAMSTCSHPIDFEIDCTYGDSISPDCRVLASCRSEGWYVSPGRCATRTDCPATPPTNGDECPSDDHPLCAYDDGTLCGCTSEGRPPQWTCFPAPSAPGCPRYVPNAGTDCSAEGVRCMYGRMGNCSWGASARCSSGTWRWDQACVGE